MEYEREHTRETNEHLSPHERLNGIVAELLHRQDERQQGLPLSYKAVVDDWDVRITGDNSGSFVFAGMYSKPVGFAFVKVSMSWEPALPGTGPEHLELLASLAEQADDWKYSTGD